MPTLIASIESTRYAATPKQIEQLAAAVVTGTQSAGLYLQTLIAATQSALGNARKPTSAQALAALESAYKPSYAAVQRGVALGGPISARTVAARSGFARTSASALRKWIEAGGDIRTLKPGEVSRRQLRPEGPAVPAGTSRAERTILLAVARITRLAERTARGDEAAARALLEQAVESLSAQLDAMADGNSQADPAVVAHRLQRVPHGAGARA